jgi:hypothetical protein
LSDRLRGAGLALGVALVLAGCGGLPPKTPAALPSVIDSPSPPPPSGAAVLPSVPPNLVSIAPIGVAVDSTLLDLVPVSAAGADLVFDGPTSATIGADAALAKDVSDVAVGLARRRGAPPDDADLAIVNVVRLRDPGLADDDEWFRDWRDSYDSAACDRAGGVARHAETAVDGVPVFVGACTNDAFTYHVRIGDGAIVLSITSVGPGDLGRRIVEGLRR